MRMIVQRVSSAEVKIDGHVCGRIGNGLLIYLGVERGDCNADMEYMAKKALELRIFSDSQGRMNLNVMQAGGAILSVSQFTLASRIQKGRRPDFTRAEDPVRAEKMYHDFNSLLAQKVPVQTGVFGAMMAVGSINDGPATFIVEKQTALTDKGN